MRLSTTPHETQATAPGASPYSRQQIVLAHGGGGQLTDELLQTSVLPHLGNDVLNQLLDSAILESMGGGRPAITIDSYVVQPWQFPGGDIGRLSVSGTINDLAVCGARPAGIALSLILAEGLSTQVLETVLQSVATTAAEAQVQVVTGDTKVVGRGQADGIYITTAGIGCVPAWRQLGPQRVQPGDMLLINGSVADHGLAVMFAREMPEVETVLRSDAAPLNTLILPLLDELGDQVVFLRDATRGGLAGVTADLARDSRHQVTLWENAIPVHPSTRHAADMLGLDPLEVANEGKLVMVVRQQAAERALQWMQQHPLGRQAACIGRIEAAANGCCVLATQIGGRRIVQKPYGEQLPRIC
jgi:hydrogenase expression/formation protein HypE